MAKGNLFLGMGRGSVGDVTFYRADGQQLSRARNRKPRNPKSNAQLIQRAISATVVQAYKAGSIIFDHSFEGKSVPAGSQRAFLSTNMRKLREQILSEINSPAAQSAASVVSPRTVYPVPNAYRISEGSLVQNLFAANYDTTNNVMKATLATSPETNETVQDYLAKLNIKAGDIFTICSFGVLGDGNRNDLQNPQCTFGFIRLTVKESAITATTLMDAATFGTVFEIDSAGAVIPSDRAIDDGISVEDIDIAGSPTGSLGIIRSNENSGLRSTSDMVSGGANGYATAWGVAPANLLAAWSQDSGQVDSELILEGGAI